MEAAVVSGDTGFLERVLAPTFVFTHGDGWVDGGAPLKVDSKASWIEYVKRQPPPVLVRASWITSRWSCTAMSR